MAPENESIFELGGKFGYESPFGDWLSERPKSIKEKANAKDNIGYDKSRSNSIGQKNDHNPDIRFVFRLGASGNGTHGHDILELNGTPMFFDRKDDEYEPGLAGQSIHLPNGTLVVRIGHHSPLLDSVLFFWKGRYRIGYLNPSAFAFEYFEVDRYALELFVNDCQRIVFEISVRAQDFKSDLGSASFAQLSAITKEVIRKVARLVELIKDEVNRPALSDQLKQSIKTFNQIYEPSLFKNAVEAQAKIMNLLSPSLENYFLRADILVPPLSVKTLINKEVSGTQSPQLIETKSRLSESGLLADLSGVGGQVFHPIVGEPNYPGTPNIFFACSEIERLGEFIGTVPPNQRSAEDTWLLNNLNWFNQTAKENLERRIIAIGEDTWTVPFWTRRVQVTGLRNSIGPLCAPPVLTQILHEIDQGDMNFYPGDTHSNDRHAQMARQEILGHLVAEKVPGSKIQNDYYQTDLLYECNVFHQVVFLHSFLKFLHL